MWPERRSVKSRLNKIPGFGYGDCLTRCVSIVGVTQLIKALMECCLPDFTRITGIISILYNEFLLPEIKIAA